MLVRKNDPRIEEIGIYQKESFAPTAPDSWKRNINEWLSSLDIKKVMKQYEDKHSDFSFFGPSPIDFDEKYWYFMCLA